jgi:MFS family permease
MVALPWLVLKLTGDTLALGLVIALMSIPRAVFILIGGALVDRYSPKRVLMLSKYANALLALLTLLVLNLDAAPDLTPHLIYAGTGPRPGAGVRHAIGDFHHAARHPAEHLQAANGVLMGMRQLSMLLGPLMAAGAGPAIIAAVAMGGVVADARGLAMAFGFDCFSYLFSAWTLAGGAAAARCATRRSGAARRRRRPAHGVERRAAAAVLYLLGSSRCSSAAPCRWRFRCWRATCTARPRSAC